MTRTADTTGRTRSRGVLAALVAIFALVLAACGPRIDTTLTLNPDGSGSRVLTLTMDTESSDWEELTGGQEAVDASIRTHLPAELEYSGLTDDGTTVTATFTLSFTSTEEYLTKAQAILAHGGVEWDDDTEVTIETSQFRSGVRVNEWFNDGELLQWMFNGLIADGVLSEEAEGSTLYESGDSAVVFGEETYTSRQPLTVLEVADNGFDALALRTQPAGDGYERVITYGLEDTQKYTANQALYDDFFASLESEGMTIADGTLETGTSWDVTITASDEADLVAKTNAALLSEETVFEVTTRADEYNPLATVWELTEYVECSAVCSQNVWSLADTVVAPDAAWEGGWATTEDGVTYTELSIYEDEPATATFSRSASFTRADVEVSLGEGSAEFTSRVRLPSAEASAVRDVLLEALGREGAEVTEEEDGEETVFVIRIPGGEDFNERYAAWSGDTSDAIEFDEYPDSGIFHRMVHMGVSLYAIPADLASSGAGASMPVTWTVHAPGGLKVDEDTMYAWAETSKVDGSTMTFEGGADLYLGFEASGTPTSFWIFWGVVLAVVLAAGVALFLMRKKIAAAFAGARQAQGPAIAPMTGAPSGPGGFQGPENEADYL